MLDRSGGTRVYTVVDVMGGFAVGAKTFRRCEDARAWLRRIRRGRDMEKDDIRLFESRIHRCSRREPGRGFSGGKGITRAPRGTRVRSGL